ncbi:MAG: cupin domain-containing protein [Candidatus Electrothrix sp. ATG1]|nr:cupin domain-containing protein [Candidatus Electrothrix sp. ATG1]MCI5208620.1 cupin domain-containing protein [Candidatus Electrothrix sp. ATG2]
MTSDDIITLLNLEPHPTEGGYFRRTYESDLHCTTENGRRILLTSIYYMLTTESPVGFLHRNKSDIIHYHQLGASIKYTVVSPDGVLSEKILGPNLNNGETLQLLVPGGWWKASRLCAGDSDYGLISEAVSPGFEYADNEITSEKQIQQLFPKIMSQLSQVIKPER